MAGQLSRKTAASLRQSGRFDDQLVALKGRVGRPRRRSRAFWRKAKRPAPTAWARIRPRSPASTASWSRPRSRGPAGRRSSRACAGWSRAATRAWPWARLGGSPMLDNLLALKAELLRREAELAGQYGERHPKIQDIRAEKGKLDRRIREERKGVLRQFEGEVARARASERILAGQARGAEGQGAAARGQCRAHRGAGARGRAEPPPVRSLPRARQCGGPALAGGGAGCADHFRGGGTGDPQLPQAQAHPVADADWRPSRWPCRHVPRRDRPARPALGARGGGDPGRADAGAGAEAGGAAPGRDRAAGLCAGPAALALRRGPARGADRAPAAPTGGGRRQFARAGGAGDLGPAGRRQVDADAEPRPRRRRGGPAGDGGRRRPAPADAARAGRPQAGGGAGRGAAPRGAAGRRRWRPTPGRR